MSFLSCCSYLLHFFADTKTKTLRNNYIIKFSKYLTIQTIYYMKNKKIIRRNME